MTTTERSEDEMFALNVLWAIMFMFAIALLALIYMELAT